MDIIVLTDNRADVYNQYEVEHGLSIFIKVHNRHFLVDTGSSSIFYRNALKAGVDIASVDYLIITHPHSDHIGGLNTFFENNSKAKIIISAQAFKKEYYSYRRQHQATFIGSDCVLDQELLNRFIFVDQTMSIVNLFTVYTDFDNKYPKPISNKFLFTMREGNLCSDDFDHEIAISFEFNEQMFVFSGCAHNGLLNILSGIKKHTAKKPVVLVVGGFHLPDGDNKNVYETDNELSEIGRKIAKNFPQALLLTGHCTGNHSFQILKDILGNRIKLFHTAYRYSYGL